MQPNSEIVSTCSTCSTCSENFANSASSVSSEILSRIAYLVGSADTVSNMPNVPALPPFNDQVLDFLNDLSKALMGYREYSDVVTFAFWIRRGSINNLRGRFNNAEGCRLGRGLAFHIAPSNVPVNFAFSLVSGLVCGNSNIVRVPSKPFPQVEIITKAINTVLQSHPEMKSYIVCCRYEHDKEINDLLSSICDVRIIWGGDRTIETLRQSPLQSRSIEITFADRYSLAVIDAEAYLAVNDKKRVAIDFYNDTFFSDQNACTSPRVVIWLGKTDEQIEAAKALFWKLEHELVKERYNFQAIQGVNKLTKAYLIAANHDVRLESHDDNLIYRVTVPEITADLMNFQDNSGYFYEYDCKESLLEIKPLCDDKKCQTIGYIGNKEMFTELLKSGVKGVDRIVPIGKTMDFDLIWDGYNLLNHLSRIISVATNSKAATKITSLADFLNILPKQETHGITVYRGHSNEAYEIKPSLFRKENEKFRERENEIIKEIEAARPNEFLPNMTTLEKLVLLQHYQLPTRLLDVTLNPLVALYFAICSSPKKDAEVLVFNMPDSLVKSFDSDTVSILANLSQLKLDEKKEIEAFLYIVENELFSLKAELNNITNEKVCNEIKDLESLRMLSNLYSGGDTTTKTTLLQDFILKLVDSHLPEDYQYIPPDELIENLLNFHNLSDLVKDEKLKYYDDKHQMVQEVFNDKLVVQHLVYFIRSEKSFFMPSINFMDLNKTLYVKVKQSNPRIVAQNGAFFIFGMKEEMKNVKVNRIKIDAQSKERIKSELSRIGINEHTLFPEFEYFITDVKRSYTKYQ